MSRFAPTSVLLADDHSMFRHALRRVLEAEPDLHPIAEADDGQEALAQMRIEPAELVIADAVMPVLNGIELIPKLLNEFPDTRVLILSGYAQASFVGRALECGASGFVTKSSPVGSLLEAIRHVVRGRTYLSPGVADVVVQSYVRGNGQRRAETNGHGERGLGGDHNGHASGHRGGTAVLPGQRAMQMVASHSTALAPKTLTSREREVLQMLAEGHPTKAIANKLCVSVKTVDTHRATLMRKLDLSGIAQLTKYAVREGITTLDY